MIEAHDLTRRYGGFTAVDGISFSIDEGEIVGILGPNGAGKTTTLRMLTGFLPPTDGEITVAGHDLVREPRAARREIGYLPEHVSLYPEMRVREYLAYRGHLVGLSRAKVGPAVDEAIGGTFLTGVEEQVIGTLSKGYRQRVGLAAAILHRPKVLVLDEPTVGLDPRQIIAIRELIRELGSHSTLLLSTHILPEVELLCDRVLILDEGRIVARGTPRELARSTRGKRRLRVCLKGQPGDAVETLAGLPGIDGVDVAENGVYHLELEEAEELDAARTDARLEAARSDEAGVTLVVSEEDEDAAAAPGEPADDAEEAEDGTPVDPTLLDPAPVDPAVVAREAVFHAAVEHGWVLLELREEATTLEDVFVRLTTRDAADTPTEAPTTTADTALSPEFLAKERAAKDRAKKRDADSRPPKEPT